MCDARAVRRWCGALCFAALLGCDDATPAVDEGPVCVDVPRDEITLRGRFEVSDRLFGGGDALTVVGECNGDGRGDIVHAQRVFASRGEGAWDEAPLPDSAGRKVGAMADLDGDGVQDLVLAGSSVEWRRGEGPCRFGAPVQIAAAVSGEPGQVKVHDVDRDGLADVIVARQEVRDRAMQLLLARGDGRFEDRTPPPTPAPGHRDVPFRTFGTFWDDLDRDGREDLFAILDDDVGWFAWGVAARWPAFTFDARVTDVLRPVSPMAVVPIDHDGDGVFAYFVSGTFGNHRLLQPRGARRLVDVAACASVREPGTVQDAWGALSFDVDLDGDPDLLYRQERDDHRGGGPTRLLVNRGDGVFAVASSATLDATLTGVGLACADLDGDGRVSCLARDTGSRGLVLLRNRIEPVRPWVGIRLRGTVSSPDASGARVSLEGARPMQVVMAGAQSPTLGEHDRAVVLAAMQAGAADVRIVWPSGIVQRVTGLATGRYHAVSEPAVLTVSPRVLRADGAGRVTVRLDGSAAGARAASVTCEGDCVWEGAATRDATGAELRVLRAPTRAGEARVGAVLDGATLTVRARVRFE